MDEQEYEHNYDIIRWEAPEFIYREKSSDWYWILGVVAAFGALIAIVLNNVLFALFIVLGAFVVALYASKHPDTLHIELNRKGLHVNDEFYPYTMLDTFWVEDLVEGKEKLLITPKNTFSLQIALPIENIDSEIVQEFLLDYIEEEQQTESVAERLMEVFHF